MTPPATTYMEHFGLRERPFSLAPDPEFIHWSDVHRSAYAMLEYGLTTRSPITLLTGDIGAGKTTLMHHFIDGLGEDVVAALISNARVGRSGILGSVCATLELAAPQGADADELFTLLQQSLLEEYRRGRRVLLFIDEAQNLGAEALEDLRMLTNINAGREEVLQLFLAGQPELRDLILQPDMEQFAQRVAASYHLPKLGPDAIAGYIATRLRAAGGQPGIFSRQAAELVHEATGGTPRLVNQLCDLALTYAFARGDTMVRRAAVQQVLDDGVFFAAGLRRGSGARA